MSDPILQAHDLFERYVADAISRAPDPLRELGDYLSRVLDEDEWKTAERFLLAACVALQESRDV